MSSGSKWSLRNGAQYQRLCARPGCGAPAAVTLRFQPTERQAWLVELDENSARTQGDLCNRHAALLVLPRGWELHDERAAAEGNPPLVQSSNGTGVRRVRVRRKAGAPGAPGAANALPGLEPDAGAGPAAGTTGSDAAPAGSTAADSEGTGTGETEGGNPVVRYGANGDDDVEQALGEILDARTPLLQRAFRNSKPL